MPVFAGDDDRVLGGAEAVPHRAIESPLELLDIPVAGLVAERDRATACVASSGCFGRGQDVGQRLADVVHVRGAVAADVVDEVRRRELRGRHRRASGDRHTPARDQRVGMEQRHRQVAGVVLGDLELLDEGLARHQHHEMRHPHRFRVAARSRREDQHVGVHRIDLAERRQVAGGLDHARPVVARGVQDLHTVEVETVEQRPVFGIGHDDLAIGPPDVGGQRLAPARRVDARTARSRRGPRPPSGSGIPGCCPSARRRATGGRDRRAQAAPRRAPTRRAGARATSSFPRRTSPRRRLTIARSRSNCWIVSLGMQVVLASTHADHRRRRSRRRGSVAGDRGDAALARTHRRPERTGGPWSSRAATIPRPTAPAQAVPVNTACRRHPASTTHPRRACWETPTAITSTRWCCTRASDCARRRWRIPSSPRDSRGSTTSGSPTTAARRAGACAASR